MKALKFSLSGETAFFKMPDVNSYYYFTYSCIHKVALLGMFGAILGLGGYNQQEKREYPEFYEKLNTIKISIIPENERGYVSKKIQTFNNSVGYASQELGGNLIVKQQWLEKPKWTIYVLLEQKISEILAQKIIARECVYYPYLGSNDHPATIESAELIEISEITSYQKIDSIVLKDYIQYQEFDEEDEDEEYFRYQEKLPIGLNANTNLYEMKDCIYSNGNVKKYAAPVYEAGKKIIAFI